MEATLRGSNKTTLSHQFVRGVNYVYLELTCALVVSLIRESSDGDRRQPYGVQTKITMYTHHQFMRGGNYYVKLTCALVVSLIRESSDGDQHSDSASELTLR